MKTSLLTILIFTIFTCNSIAQTEATTSKGKKVILNDDGTWKYKEMPAATNTETSNLSGDCNKYIETTEDKVTGKSTTASKNMLIVSKDGGKKGFGIFLMKGEKSVIISIQAVGAGGCIDDDAKMNILFRDGTRLELTNDGKFNCDAKYTLYFGGYFGKKKELELLKTKEIETMRIWTSKSYVEENFTDDQSNELLKSLNCISSE